MLFLLKSRRILSRGFPTIEGIAIFPWLLLLPRRGASKARQGELIGINRRAHITTKRADSIERKQHLEPQSRGIGGVFLHLEQAKEGVVARRGQRITEPP